MTAKQLYDCIKNIPKNCEEFRYSVISLEGMPHKIGCSEEGFPKFFVQTSGKVGVMQNLNAELLSVEYGTLCNIIDDKKQIDNAKFTIITLRSDNEQLQKTFVDVFLAMLRTIPLYPTNVMIASKVESLLSIFSKLKKSSCHGLQGLWAELLLIEQSKKSSVVANAWHNSPDAKYDFTMGKDKIEVKSTSSENRIHHFSLDQLNPSESSRLLVCSIIVRESAQDVNGLSVFDLYEKISAKVCSDEIRLHIYSVMMETLGSDFFVAEKKYFDYIAACDSLALFEYADVPRIDKACIPEHISEVKFCVNLEHLNDVRKTVFDREDSVLYNALY